MGVYEDLESSYKYGAKKRLIEYKLPFYYFKKLIILDCYYCGEKPNKIKSSRNKTKHTILVNGIDRLDSSKGYTEDNCVPCCADCNLAKADMSPEDFVNHIRRIYAYLDAK